MLDTKSAWRSKINWVQAVSGLAIVLAYFGFDLDAETQAAIIAGIGGANIAITWVLRTFFTKTLTRASAR